MQPQVEQKIENKPQEQNVQADKKTIDTLPENKEASPPIKSEENQENWRKFREQRELDRKEKIEAEKRARQKEEEAEALRKAIEALTNKPVYQDQQEETEEQRIEKKVQEAIQKERERYRKEEEEEAKRQMPNLIKRAFSDFDEVCSQENLDYLEYHEPEIARAFSLQPDSIEKWQGVYKAVKRFVPNTNSKKDAAKIEKNLSKPQSMSSTGLTKSENAMPPMQLTEERRRENWLRMQRIINKLD